MTNKGRGNDTILSSSRNRGSRNSLIKLDSRLRGNDIKGGRNDIKRAAGMTSKKNLNTKTQTILNSKAGITHPFSLSYLVIEV